MKLPLEVWEVNSNEKLTKAVNQLHTDYEKLSDKVKELQEKLKGKLVIKQTALEDPGEIKEVDLVKGTDSEREGTGSTKQIETDEERDARSDAEASGGEDEDLPELPGEEEPADTPDEEGGYTDELSRTEDGEEPQSPKENVPN